MATSKMSRAAAVSEADITSPYDFGDLTSFSG